MVLPERYLSPTGAGERTGLDEANAWGIVEYLANHTRNMFVHVKSGLYEFGLNGANVFVGNQHGSGIVTNGFPLILQGYRSVPGDLSSGPLQDLPVFRAIHSNGHFETSANSSNIEARNIRFESWKATFAAVIRGHVNFFRCAFINFATNTNAQAIAVSKPDAQMCVFEHCLFQNFNEHPSASALLFNGSFCVFVGCAFVGPKQMIRFSENVIASECVFVAQTKSADNPGIVISSGLAGFLVRNCVFDGFDTAISFQRPSTEGAGAVAGQVINSIFVNNNRAIAIDLPGVQTKNDTSLRNNAVFGPVAFTGFGNDLERIDSRPIVLQDTPFEPGSYVLKNDAVGQQCKNVGSPRYIQHEHTLNPLDLGVAQSFLIPPAPHDYPQTRDVRFGVPYDNGNFVGTARIPASRDVRHSVAVDDGLGSLSVPDRTRVVWGVPTDDTVGALEHSVVVERAAQ